MITLDNFEKVDEYELSLVPEDNDVGGGRITKEEIDNIREFPNAKSLKISGLNQENFEYLISRYGNQFEAIAFFKNKTISDLSILGSLNNIKYIYYFFNQKAADLWNMTNNKNLIGLGIYDFSKLHTIEMIPTAPTLQFFSIGNKVWGTAEIESLKPLTQSAVTHFAWWGKKILDNDFQCLAKSRVTELDLNICSFRMEELAHIVASIPGLCGKATTPYREFGIHENEKSTVYYNLCKGKRSLIKGKDESKLKEYLAEFDGLVEKYRANG